MGAVIRVLRQELLDEVQDNYFLAADSQATAKQCMRGLFGFQAMLVDLDNDIHHHPYVIFAGPAGRLHRRHCVLRDMPPTEIDRPYCARGPGGELQRPRSRARRAGADQAAEDSVHRSSCARRGMFSCALAKDVKRAKEVFLLVQKPQVSTVVDLTRVKLAGESRVQVVHERALRGIPIQRLDSPPFHHGMSRPCDRLYAIAAGQEWDYALREGKMALYDAPQLQGSRLYLYWRTD